MSTMEADGFMYGIGFFTDEEQSDSQSEITAASSISVRFWDCILVVLKFQLPLDLPSLTI